MKYLLNQQGLNAWQARWLEFLSEFVFEIKHIKGKENKVAKALRGRKSDIYEIIVSKAGNDLGEKIKFVGTRDEEYEKLKEKLMTYEEEINGTDFKID